MGIFGLLFAAMIYGLLKALAVWRDECEQIRIAERAAERYACRCALERAGYTVVINPVNGDITGYFKSGSAHTGGTDTNVARAV